MIITWTFPSHAFVCPSLVEQASFASLYLPQSRIFSWFPRPIRSLYSYAPSKACSRYDMHRHTGVLIIPVLLTWLAGIATAASGTTWLALFPLLLQKPRTKDESSNATTLCPASAPCCSTSKFCSRALLIKFDIDLKVNLDFVETTV